jgi:transglutaminase-like putative cysteine protease
MLYDVTLRISHRYAQRATAARHVFHLVPLSLPDEQQRIAASLDIAPRPSERTERSDFFGNTAVDAAFNAAHVGVDLTLRARIRRRTKGLPLDLSPPLGELARDIAETRTLAPDSPHHFLPPSVRAPHAPAVAALARDAVAGAATTLEAVRRFGQAIHDVMTFEVGATTVDTPIEDAFARRRGVCQDFTHVMISGLRAVGVPAGYVSGFLRTTPPPGMERLQGADAMHAWARAWCGREQGWVEYDPTNAVFVLDDHLVLARGRDYADVAPVRGVLRTAGAQSSTHSVDVVVIEDA